MPVDSAQVFQAEHVSCRVVELSRADISDCRSTNCSARPSEVCQPMWQCIYGVVLAMPCLRNEQWEKER